MRHKKISIDNSNIISPVHGKRILFFSGGTALNFFIEEIKHHTYNTIHIIPISDNGGSTAEILRNLGGPAIGDIRSRLIRLAVNISPEVETLLSYRFHKHDKTVANDEFQQLIQGVHPLLNGVKAKDLGYILGPLVQFNKRISIDEFDLRNGSVGNFFFKGCGFMFENPRVSALQTGINFFSGIAGIPHETKVIPVIDQDDAITIAVELENGDIILGQNTISHPGRLVDKNYACALQSPIKRLFYVDTDLPRYKIIDPTVNIYALNKLNEHPSIVFAPGSLYTSILPNLILRGVGEAIAGNSRTKIACLNGYTDREFFGTATNYIIKLTEGLNRYGELHNKPYDYIHKLFVVDGTKFDVNKKEIHKLGIEVIPVKKGSNSTKAKPLYDTKAFTEQLLSGSI